MSRVATMFGEIGFPLLLEQLGETVTHRPGNVAADDAAVSAIVELDSVDGFQLDPLDNENGSRRLRQGRLFLAVGTTVTVAERENVRDTFVIRGELWIAHSLAAPDGVQLVVNIVREEPISTKRTRVMR